MKMPTPVCTLPLDLEIVAALATLREKGYLRAATRLERMSQRILRPKPKGEKTKTRKIPVRAIRTASGKKLKLTRAISIDADRIEE